MTTDLSSLKIIFHHSRVITDDGKSGSQVRPYKMLIAFRKLGVNVTEVVGNARQRVETIQKIKQRIAEGELFDFVYSENLTVPVAMSESHRLPTRPFLDHNFLEFCHQSSIPVALFYRDVYWRDSSYKHMLSCWGRLITIPLYNYDWARIRKYVTTLYIPSLGMKSRLPHRSCINFQILPLPPAADPKDVTERDTSSNQVNIVYVGGVEPPIYDLHPLLKTMASSGNVKLTICCRETEWKKYKHLYAHSLTDRVKIVHKSGRELDDLYKKADIQAIVREPTPYLDFAVPVKLFESVGYGVPVLSTPGSEAARLIETDGLGWIKSMEQIPEFIRSLTKNPELISQAKSRLAKQQHRHSWEARAKQVCNDMTSIRKNNHTSTPARLAR